MLKAGMPEGGLLIQRTGGTPQGWPLSPLLSNIVLDELAKEQERRDCNYVCYADDLKIFASTKWQAERIKAKVANLVEGRLKDGGQRKLKPPPALILWPATLIKRQVYRPIRTVYFTGIFFAYGYGYCDFLIQKIYYAR